MKRGIWSLFACLLAAGCAGSTARPQAPPAAPPPSPLPSPAASAPASPPPATGEAAVSSLWPPAVAAEPELDEPSQPLAPSRFLVAEARERQRAEEQALAQPCRPPDSRMVRFIDEVQRQIYKTMCGAALWFDGLFGEQQHPAAAEKTSGRVEFSGAYSEYDGAKVRTLLDVRFRIPNMENKLEAFLGRDNDQDFVEGRQEGLALRPLFLTIEGDDRWVAGLGYGLPGNYKQKSDVRLGVRGGVRTPETFAQARYRRNFFFGEKNLWHFREIAFWTNREGFGATTVLDFDHVVNPTMLWRWANTTTNSQDTHAWWWRSAFIWYQNLHARRAIAYEAYVRGETQAEVPLQEYGARTIYRHGFPSREWLYGEVVVGYSWPRFELAEPRRGSAAIALGLELLFGRN